MAKNSGINARIPILSQVIYCQYQFSRVLLGTYFIKWWHILNGSSRYHISRIMNLSVHLAFVHVRPALSRGNMGDNTVPQKIWGP
jgi:hypothetical protein